MITLEDLHANPGDSIPDKWRKLEQFVMEQRARHEDMTGSGLLKTQGDLGFHYLAAPSAEPVFRGALYVSLSSGQVSVGAGTIDNLTPTIDGVRCDGYDADGKLGTIPKLKLTDPPNDQLRSWICAEAIRAADVAGGSDAGSFVPIDPEDPDALIITHRADLTGNQEPGTENLTGILPLALVVWFDQKTPAFAQQIVYFNQRTKIEDDELRFSAAS